MMKNVNQLVVLPFIYPGQDLSRLLALYTAIETVDHEDYQVNEQVLRDQLFSPGHDPLRDRWVVEAPGDPSVLIGSALVRVDSGSDYSVANIFVHPDWRRRGVGSQLLSRVIERSRQLGSTAVQIFASSMHPAAPAFLAKYDFIAQGTYTELRLKEGIRLPPVIWPYGYTMRPYSEVQDLAILTQAMNLSYIPLWGHHEVSEEELSSWLPGFILDGIFLVFSEKGRVVGISRVEPSPERTQKNGSPTGYIDAPGVVPQHRRLDLYRALVLTGIHWLYEHGQTLVEMESWGDKLEVLKMYRELGFTNLRQLVCYQYDLAKGAGEK
jgi:mycothiol synthase